MEKKPKAIRCPFADEIIQQKEREIDRLNERIRNLEKRFRNEITLHMGTKAMLRIARGEE